MPLNTASFSSDSDEDSFLKISSYKPNFILLTDNKSFFGDIIPVYKSYQELSDIIISSKESLVKMVFVSSVFFVCLLSLLLESINNIAYQSLLFVSSIKNQVVSLPDQYTKIKNSFVELTNILTNREIQGLWWLNFKLSLKQDLATFGDFFSTFTTVISKFYLTVVVVAVLFIISSSSSISGNLGKSSVLSKAINNHTQNPTVKLANQNSLPIVSLLQQSSDINEQLLNSQVITHNVQTGENVDIIAEMYGLTPETVVFNNQLDESKPLPEKLYLPWSEGYLYQTKADTTVEDLEKIYSIDKNLIYSENEDTLDRDKGVFPVNSFVLIPTTNYTDIAKSNDKENTRKQNLEQSNLQKNSVKKSLVAAKKATTSNKSTFAGTFSDNKSSGFIWPTQGNISRCVTGAHVACDIANASLPAIFATQKGTVSSISYQPRGYGNVITIDHGDGLQTLYAHMSEIYVEAGQEVIQGQSVGKMGCTGLCTGPHLHFEVRLNGTKQNPLTYLP